MSEPVGQRITAYLAGGGLFNPKLANHDAVRDLLIDCRAALERAEREREELRADAERYRWLRTHSWLDKAQSTPAIYFGAGCNQSRPDILDAAIDAALRGGDDE